MITILIIHNVSFKNMLEYTLMANPEQKNVFNFLDEYNEATETYVDPKTSPKELKKQKQELKNVVRTLITYSDNPEYEVDVQIKNGEFLWTLINEDMQNLKMSFYEDEQKRKNFFLQLDNALDGFEKVIFIRKNPYRG